MSRKRKLWLHAGRHKTGSSAIQNNLYRRLNDPNYDYLDLGKANASSVINNAFNPSLANTGDPAERTSRAQGALRRAIESSTRSNAILSAESISLLGESEFQGFMAFLQPHFDDIELLAYFRPPKADMESAFAEKLKTGFTAWDAPVEFKHRQRFEMFERYLHRSKIHYLRYASEDFPGGDVVTHFCRYIGISHPPPATPPANLRLSLPAVRLLYLYRSKYTQMRSEDKALIAKLTKLQGPPLRFHSEVFNSKFQDPLSSFDWLENRSGLSFNEDIYADDEVGIRHETDLQLIDALSAAWLQQHLGLEQEKLDELIRQPGLVADLLHGAHVDQ